MDRETRIQHQANWRRRQRQRGLRHIAVWIPADKVDDLHFYAAQLRAGKSPADVAVNSIGRLPISTNEESKDEQNR